MASTTRGYTYPASTDHDRIWEHIETLAEDIDSDVQTVADEVEDKPVGRIRQTVAQSGVANITIFAVTMDTEDHDTGGFHSTSSNTSRVTPTTAGYYQVKGVVTFAGQTDYVGLDAIIRTNGSTTLPGAGRQGAPGSNTTVSVPVSAQVQMNGSTDYFELCGRATRGTGTSGTTVSSFLASTLEWEWLRPL